MKLNKALNRLKEPSTLRGIFLLLGVAGINISPELANQIIGAVASIIGIIEVFRKEK